MYIMANVFCCCCCKITLRTITIFLLCINIIFLTLGVGVSLFCYDSLSIKFFFDREVEISMAYVFALIEVLVFFGAIFFAFGRKSSLLTFSTVMLLLESFFIIFIAVRVHYDRKNFKNIWDNIFESVILKLPIENLKEFVNKDEQSKYLASGIIFYSIFVLILIFKLCCAMVVNNFKNQLETIRIENIFHQLLSGSRKLKSSRTTSYDIYSAITDMVNQPFY